MPVQPSGARPSLPKGCYVGVPVVAGTPARSLPEGKALFQVAMSFVENDDYYGVVELVRASNGTLDLKRKCGFSVAPRPEAGVIDANFPVPLVCEPGTHLTVIMRQLAGAATASQVVMGGVHIRGVFE